jgi:1-aminocyclopropane-1-carboxylate deaminase/D-cysteine desulfhydrase-like pyridoxal-dependent ACC family enzyme
MSAAGHSSDAAPQPGFRDLQIAWRPLAELVPAARNARTHSPEQIDQIAASILEFGWTNPILIDEAGEIIAGHGRVLAGHKVGSPTGPTITLDGLTAEQKAAYRIADNKLALNAGWDEAMLAQELRSLQATGYDLALLGFSAAELAALMEGVAGQPGAGNLSAKFGIPPFTVFNAREGWWQARKAAWIALGIQSELGRGEMAVDETLSKTARMNQAARGRDRYNRREVTIEDPAALTPVERHGEFWFKRDDLFAIDGAPGGKVRTCLALAQAGLAAGRKGLVTAGSRASPQVNIVAHVARRLGVPARCHTPTGELSPEVAQAAAIGAEIVQHKAGYNNVIIARAHEDAVINDWVEIPFGMECWEAVTQTRRQIANLPAEVTSIVVPIGSGMSLAGILHGLDDAGRKDMRVTGVWVGADPKDRLDEYAEGWRRRQRLILCKAAGDYHTAAPDIELAGVLLDPYYEAKCIPFMEPGDLLWCVGIRATARPARRGYAVPGGARMPAVDPRTGKIVRSDSRARPIPGT